MQTGERTQAWLDTNYPLHEFAASRHNGGDIVGSGDVVSQVAGTLSMGWDNTYGMSAFTVSAMNPGVGFQNLQQDWNDVSFLREIGW